jgi:biopolymer transport protein ExbB
MSLFRELIERGGPVMWPLVALSVLAVAVVVERTWILARFSWRLRRGGKRLAAVRAALAAGDRAAAETAARAAGPAGECFAEALSDGDLPLEDAAQIAAEKRLRALKRRLAFLDTTITLAPLLGILGTVTGIISSFRLFAGGNAGDPAAVSGGIAEALLTTAAGLVIAIMALLPYNALCNAVGGIASSLAHELDRLVAAAKKGSGRC